MFLALKCLKIQTFRDYCPFISGRCRYTERASFYLNVATFEARAGRVRSNDNSVPYSQFLRLKRICSDANDYKTKSKEMVSFFLEPFHTLTLSPEIQRYDHLTTDNPTEKVIPLILTYNPINHHVKNILSRNFDLLKSDPETKELFGNSRVLGAYRRDTNLRDSLVSSNLKSGANPGGRGTPI